MTVAETIEKLNLIPDKDQMLLVDMLDIRTDESIECFMISDVEYVGEKYLPAIIIKKSS